MFQYHWLWHVGIFRFSVIYSKYIPQTPLKWSVIFLKSWTSTNYFSNSTGSSITSKPVSLVLSWIRGSFHTSQEPWPWSCESPNESVQRLSQRHPKNHVLWSQTLKCSVKSYVTGPSINNYFNDFLFMRVCTHDKIKINQRLWAFGVPWSLGFMLGLPLRGGF